MKYTPCDNSSFQATRYYCGYNAKCFEIFKSKALLKEVYDRRDGTACSTSAAQCPC